MLFVFYGNRIVHRETCSRFSANYMQTVPLCVPLSPVYKYKYLKT